MTQILNVTGAVTPELIAALNANFAAIDARLDGMPAEWSIKTANFTAVAHGQYDCNTTDAGFTATLPASLEEGDRFTFNDFASTWGTNALVIDPNGHEFEDAGDGSDPTEPMTCDGTAQFSLVYAAGKLRLR